MALAWAVVSPDWLGWCRTPCTGGAGGRGSAGGVLGAGLPGGCLVQALAAWSGGASGVRTCVGALRARRSGGLEGRIWIVHLEGVGRAIPTSRVEGRVSWLKARVKRARSQLTPPG